MTESLYPSIDIPDVDLFGFLFEQEVTFPEEKGNALGVSAQRSLLTRIVIYVDPLTRRQYTYLEVKQTAIEIGQTLRTQWNWQKGDVIGVFSANSIDMPVAIFGALWANGVVTPANPAYNTSELAFQ